VDTGIAKAVERPCLVAWFGRWRRRFDIEGGGIAVLSERFLEEVVVQAIRRSSKYLSSAVQQCVGCHGSNDLSRSKTKK